MTIDEAIEILTPSSRQPGSSKHFPFQEAVRLGIEALIRCKELRKYTPPKTYIPLPGETTE